MVFSFLKLVFFPVFFYSFCGKFPVIDTHSHIDLPVFADSFTEVLARARTAGVTAQVLPGVVRDGWQRILQLSAEESDLFAAIGLHPMYLSHHGSDNLQELRRLAQTERLVAIGEIGLDYFVKDVDHSAQQELFEAQLAIAAEAGLPVLLHVRKAHDQVQATIRRMKFCGGGIVHAFSGSLQQAEQYIKLGFLISVCGTVTYDRARKIRAVAQVLPLDSLVVETDSPDIPPASHHGERNYPEFLPDIMVELSLLRSESYQELVSQTEKNSRRMLSL
ncbi:MAG: TatD family deoxyribonuclease [Desulfocapsa sp.]|nr:MAG: TatD family deoxyribonuclease [Desulfocapsa sp.]